MCATKSLFFSDEVTKATRTKPGPFGWMSLGYKPMKKGDLAHHSSSPFVLLLTIAFIVIFVLCQVQEYSSSPLLTITPTTGLHRDIKISGFSMSLKGNELISDCSIELTVGRRYGLIGQNGCGKTNFLQALANRDVSTASNPWRLSVLSLHSCVPKSVTESLAGMARKGPVDLLATSTITPKWLAR